MESNGYLKSAPQKIHNYSIYIFLVGGWTNPFEKYARQIGSFSQGSGWK